MLFLSDNEATKRLVFVMNDTPNCSSKETNSFPLNVPAPLIHQSTLNDTPSCSSKETSSFPLNVPAPLIHQSTLNDISSCSSKVTSSFPTKEQSTQTSPPCLFLKIFFQSP